MVGSGFNTGHIGIQSDALGFRRVEFIIVVLVWACVVMCGIVLMVFGLMLWVSAGFMGDVVVAMVCVRAVVTIRPVDALAGCVLINGVCDPSGTV